MPATPRHAFSRLMLFRAIIRVTDHDAFSLFADRCFHFTLFSLFLPVAIFHAGITKLPLLIFFAPICHALPLFRRLMPIPRMPLCW